MTYTIHKLHLPLRMYSIYLIYDKLKTLLLVKNIYGQSPEIGSINTMGNMDRGGLEFAIYGTDCIEAFESLVKM